MALFSTGTDYSGDYILLFVLIYDACREQARNEVRALVLLW